MKKSKRRLQQFTNQIGKGDGAPNFELVRPPENNFFQLEVIQSRSFKQSHAAREITYRAKLKDSSDDVPLNNLLPHLHALFDTILQETKRDYGDAGVMRIYISHPKLENVELLVNKPLLNGSIRIYIQERTGRRDSRYTFRITG